MLGVGLAGFMPAQDFLECIELRGNLAFYMQVLKGISQDEVAQEEHQ